MRQTTFCNFEYSNRRRKTYREKYLNSMKSIMPWDQWVRMIRPFYPSGKRDPEMHQTKKGNQWYFGMKVHAGVDAGTWYIHTVTATPANVNDVEETSLPSIEYRINKRPSSIKINPDYTGYQWDREMKNRKSSVLSKVEHPFLIVKIQFGYSKTAYRGLAKNLNRFHVLFASANLLMCIRADRVPDFVTG